MSSVHCHSTEELLVSIGYMYTHCNLKGIYTRTHTEIEFLEEHGKISMSPVVV